MRAAFVSAGASPAATLILVLVALGLASFAVPEVAAASASATEPRRVQSTPTTSLRTWLVLRTRWWSAVRLRPTATPPSTTAHDACLAAGQAMVDVDAVGLVGEGKDLHISR